jgi:uncharacterized protein
MIILIPENVTSESITYLRINETPKTMQFILMAYDGADKDALERRMNARPMHLDKVKELKEQGHFIFGGAILDDNQTMVGSVVIYEFPDWEDIENYLEAEPYIMGGVWQKIEIKPFRAAPI